MSASDPASAHHRPGSALSGAFPVIMIAVAAALALWVGFGRGVAGLLGSLTPVYAAGEAPVDGVDADALVAGLRRRGHRDVQTVADADALAEALASEVHVGDQVICLGAGDITKWAAGLAPAIEARR